MRKVGDTPNQDLASQFVDYLSLQGISAVVRDDSDETCSVWVHDEDKVPEIRQELADFLRSPYEPKFNSASREYARLRQLARQLDDVIPGQSPTETQPSEPKEALGWRQLWRDAPLSLTIGVLCIVVGLQSDFGSREQSASMTGLRFDRKPLQTSAETPPSEMQDIRNGQVWRLVTPVFLHLGPIHLLMNLMWFFFFAKQVEMRIGTERMALLFVGLAIVSNLSQFLMTGPDFLGLSGVCFGLFGYVWVRAWSQPLAGYFITNETIVIGTIILLLGFLQTDSSNDLHTANWAHLGGLLCGLLAGWVQPILAREKNSQTAAS